MKVLLLYRDRDFDLQRELPASEPTLTQDLELNALFHTMARGNEFLLDVVRKAVLTSLTDPNSIYYRQDILKDCLNHPDLIREIYALAVEAITRERKNYWGSCSEYPRIMLHRSLEVMQMFVSVLRKLRRFETMTPSMGCRLMR